jgi:hypothetical protein
VNSGELPRPAIRHDRLTHSEEARNARHEMIRADIARRLRNACSYLGDEEFAALVDKLVEVQLKSERGAGKPVA